MLDLFNGLFETTASSISVANFLLCVVSALVLGLALSIPAGFKNRVSKSFSLALALLPAAVCVVIMLVNGNIGAGVAVAGAFGLVRFRSAAGTARDIVLIFTAMGIGLITGMGYIAYAALFTVIMAGMYLLYTALNFGEGGKAARERTLSVTIPEDLNYCGVFEPVFAEYTDEARRLKVKTTNLGTMFRLKYTVTLKKDADEKAFIDALRLLNGNLEILLQDREDAAGEL